MTQRRRRGRKPVSKFSRPFATYYYADAGADEDAYIAIGSSKTEEGAIRGAVFRVFVHAYGKALIYSRDTGALLYTIEPTGNGLGIFYGRRLRRTR